MKFIKDFRGVPDGEIYPAQYAAGDECPPELEAGALEVGALEAQAKKSPEPVAAETEKPKGKGKAAKDAAEPVAAEASTNANSDN